MPPSSHRRQALQALLLCTSFWALSFPVMKTLALTQQRLLPGANSWFLSSLCVAGRFLAAGMVLFLLSPSQLRSVNRREVEQGLWLALFAAVGICLQMDGLALNFAYPPRRFLDPTLLCADSPLGGGYPPPVSQIGYSFLLRARGGGNGAAGAIEFLRFAARPRRAGNPGLFRGIYGADSLPGTSPNSRATDPARSQR